MRRAEHVQEHSNGPENRDYQVKTGKSNAKNRKIDILENQNAFGTLGRRGHNSSGFKPRNGRGEQSPNRQVSRTTPLAGIDYRISSKNEPPKWIKIDSFKMRNPEDDFEQKPANKRKVSENSREFNGNGQRMLKPIGKHSRSKQQFGNKSREESDSDLDENVDLEEYSRKIQNFLSGRKASREGGNGRNRGKSDGRRERPGADRHRGSISTY